jgi:L,D-peptidoglycan transpeptidase YkuD (ErfK/YbiS/YcfS/YnhG family)
VPGNDVPGNDVPGNDVPGNGDVRGNDDVPGNGDVPGDLLAPDAATPEDTVADEAVLDRPGAAVPPGGVEGPGPGHGGAGHRQPRRHVLPYALKRLGLARQLVVVVSRSWTGTQARLEAYEDGPHGWELVMGPELARVGRTGMIPAQRRVAGSGTTPAGTFPLTLAFGLEPDPGTAVPYVHVTSDDHWWVGDPASAHYNNLRLGAAGGFHGSEHGKRGSKRIAAHPGEYAYALVIDFNRPVPDRKQGAGICIRVSTGLSTDGSVAVEREVLVELLRWLDPVRDPMITIAPERVISQY